MSDRGHAHPYDYIDASRLIEEVKKRAPIWDKSLDEHQDRLLRTQLWEEVSEQMYSGYAALSNADKKQTFVNIQKKWRNIRDAYAKEFLKQQKDHLNKKGPKKKEYVHFQALSFLSSNFRNKRTRQLPYFHINEDSNYSIDDSNNDAKRVSQRNKTRRTGNTSTKLRTKQDVETHDTQEVIASPQPQPQPQYSNTNYKIYDEDISFTEMMVPMLKKLNEDQKHFAKTEIMNILYQAKTHGPPEIVHQITVKEQSTDEENDPFE